MWNRIQKNLHDSGWPGQIYWQQALLGAPALLGVLALGVEWSSHAAAVMTGAAFSIAFGAAHTLGGYRWGAMVAACISMALAGVLGSLTGAYGLLTLILAGLLTATSAVLSSYHSEWWWVTLQTVCAYLIASYYPSSGWNAAWQRGGLILAGGSLQILFTAVVAWIFPKRFPPLPAKIVQQLPVALLWRFSAASAAAVMASLWLARHIGLRNDYWAAITAVMILRPEGHETVSRGLHRLGGTILGCALATLAVLLLHEYLPWMVLCTILTAATAFAVQRAQYAVLAAMVSATVVFLFAVAHNNPLAAAEHRIEATALGGTIALLAGLGLGILHTQKK